MQHRHREVLMNILKVYGGGNSRTISPHPGVSQEHLYQQMMYQQQQQRIPSPMNNGLLIKTKQKTNSQIVKEMNLH